METKIIMCIAVVMNILQYHFYGKNILWYQKTEKGLSKDLKDLREYMEKARSQFLDTLAQEGQRADEALKTSVQYQKQADVYYKEINQLKIDKMALQTKLDQLTFALMHIAGKVHSNQWSSAKKQIHKIFIKEDIEVQQHVINTMFGCNHSQEAILRQIRRVEKGSK